MILWELKDEARFSRVFFFNVDQYEVAEEFGFALDLHSAPKIRAGKKGHQTSEEGAERGCG